MINKLDIDSLQSRLIKGVVIAGGLYFGYRVTTKVLKNWKERNTSALADQSRSTPGYGTSFSDEP